MDQRKERRSRRALLTGAAAGAAAVAAKTLTPTPAQAADGDPVLLGQTNTSVSSTTIQGLESPLIAITATDDGALVGINTNTEEGYGVRAIGAYIGLLAGGGEAGVHAISNGGDALRVSGPARFEGPYHLQPQRQGRGAGRGDVGDRNRRGPDPAESGTCHSATRPG
jgi:hypothetical protein